VPSDGAEVAPIALRYGATASLPMASMYRATQRQLPDPEDESSAHARAFDLTNGLLASGQVVEVNLIANRLVLAHQRVMPAIYALAGGQPESSLSDSARQALDFIASNAGATSGEIRRLLRVDGQRRPDAADLALSELQRALLIDRGPSSGPSTGVFYLSREGYPYRIFATAHPLVVAAAKKLDRPAAATALLMTYLAPARFATRRTLLALFKSLLSADEIDAVIDRQTASGQLERVRYGREERIVPGSTKLLVC